MINYSRMVSSVSEIKKNVVKLFDFTNGSTTGFPDLSNVGEDEILKNFIGENKNQTEAEIKKLAFYGYDAYGFDSHDRCILSMFIKNIYLYRKMIEKGIDNPNAIKASFNSEFYQLDYSNANVLEMIDDVCLNILGITTLFEISKTSKVGTVISNALLVKTLVNGYNLNRCQVVSSNFKFPYYAETITDGEKVEEVVFFATNTEFYNCVIDLPPGKIIITGCKFVNCTFNGANSCVIYVHDNDARFKIYNMFIGNKPSSQFKDRFENTITIV